MKKLLLLLIVFLLYTGCARYGIISLRTNAAEKTATLTMRFKHSSMEKQSADGNQFISKASYYREIKSKKKMPARITFTIETLKSFNTLKSQGFVRVNKKTYPLHFSGITSKAAEAEGMKNITGTAALPLNVEQEILKVKFFAFRFYIDATPVTFIVKGNNLAAVKSFFKSTESYVAR